MRGDEGEVVESQVRAAQMTLSQYQEPSGELCKYGLPTIILENVVPKNAALFVIGMHGYVLGERSPDSDGFPSIGIQCVLAYYVLS